MKFVVIVQIAGPVSHLISFSLLLQLPVFNYINLIEHLK